MVDVRFEYYDDGVNDCLTIVDNQDKIKTAFDSEIILSPLEDAMTIIIELNVQCAIVDMLVEQLEYHEDIQDIKYWIKEVREDLLG